jgi:hypothetical protein
LRDLFCKGAKWCRCASGRCPTWPLTWTCRVPVPTATWW